MTVSLHLRGLVLADGVERDIFVRDGVFTLDAGEDARTVLDGGYIIPGLVDTHAHLPFTSPTSPELSWEEQAEASALAQRDAGVLAIRDPGGPTPPSLGSKTSLPRIVTAGRFLGVPGRTVPGSGQIELPEEEIPEAAEEQFKASGSWVKLIGDFPVPDQGFKTSFSVETLTEVTKRIHVLGGRVAIHAIITETIEAAVEAGVDTIEHGLMVTSDQAVAMADRGVALVPTMVTTGVWPGLLEQLKAPDRRIRETLAAIERQPEAVRTAWEAGVTLLAGTDAGRLIPHGLVRDEVQLLASAGIAAKDALAAASWKARSYLGLRGIEDDAPADLVAFKRNPLKDPGALAEPELILLDGQVIAAQSNH